MKILEIIEIDKNGRGLIHSHSNEELVEAIKELQELIIKDKFKKCENCKHKDGDGGGLIHCSYFEEFMPTEIGKCDIWESKC